MRHPSDEIIALAIINRNIVRLGRMIEALEAHMTQEFEQVQQATDAITADVANVTAALDAQKAAIAALTQQVADLQAQIDAGNPVTSEQLQAVADQLNAADAALDAATAPPTP